MPVFSLIRSDSVLRLNAAFGNPDLLESVGIDPGQACVGVMAQLRR